MSRNNIQEALQNNTEEVPTTQSSNPICYRTAARTDHAVTADRFSEMKLKEGLRSFVLQLLKKLALYIS